MGPATDVQGFATCVCDIGGLYLQPVDTAGILPRGLCWNVTAASSFTSCFYLSAIDSNVTLDSPTSAVASRSPLVDAGFSYR